MKPLAAIFWPRDTGLRLILLLALVLGLIYNAVIRVGDGPDEPRHINYVRLLWDEHRLPFQLPDGPDLDRDPDEYRGAHTYHPPLYYILLLPLYAVAKALPDAALGHLLRLGSLVFSLAALPLVFAVARRAGGVWPARFATLGIAWTPMWGMTAATVNNDSATLFFVALALWLLVEKFPSDRSTRAAAWIGLAVGLGALCKATALLCGVAAFLVAIGFQSFGAKDWRPALKQLAVFGGVIFLVAGWWHLRSLRLYGTFTPLPTPIYYFNPPLSKAEEIMHPAFPMLFTMNNWAIFYSLWGQRDWFFQPPVITPTTPAPIFRVALYLLMLLFCLFGLVGLTGRRKKEAPQETDLPDLRELLAIWCPSAAFLLTWATILNVALFYHRGWTEGGRYLLPILLGFSIPLARGWERWTGARIKGVTLAFGLFLLLLNGGALYWLVFHLNAHFHP